jgi:hypothetical protein
MIDRYCQALGLHPFDETFFGSDCLLVSIRNPRPDLKFNVSEQQARYGCRADPGDRLGS